MSSESLTQITDEMLQNNLHSASVLAAVIGMVSTLIGIIILPVKAVHIPYRLQRGKYGGLGWCGYEYKAYRIAVDWSRDEDICLEINAKTNDW